MNTRQLVVFIIFIAVSLILFVLFYMRPKAQTSQQPTRYKLWKLLLVVSISIVLVGIIMLLLPANIF